MPRRIEIEEYVDRAEKIAEMNGGFLPNMTRLSDMGEASVLRAIRADRAPFEHILPKLGRGRDKVKYAYVGANLDEDDDKLAKDVGVSKTTVRNWKNEIRRDGYRDVDVETAPDDASMGDVADFILKNLPERWTLDVTFDDDGCYLTLLRPDGVRRGVDEADGMPVARSAVVHVNHARAREGLPPVSWPD